MDEREQLAGIEEVVDQLRDRATCGAVILVEGRRDREALEALGVRGEIVLTSHKTLLTLSESLARAGRDVIILTDWDERGEEVARQISLFMEADGARPDSTLRGSLKSLLRKDIKDVESLYSFVEKLKEVCSTKPQHY